jgi:signal transduction histidine kinase
MVSHLAHEINNPLNFISTGEIISRESLTDVKNYIFSAIPDSAESKPFQEKIKSLFHEVEEGFQQSAKGTIRIKDTIQEIRAITGVDGIHVDNFDIIPVIYQNWELTLEKNQASSPPIEFEINQVVWPNRFNLEFQILSQKYIFSRAIRTILNNAIFFTKNNPNPKIQINLQFLDTKEIRMISIQIRNNGPSIEPGKEAKLFDLKLGKYFGTELIGLPLVKEILKSVQCNLTLTDHGRTSGWVEFQIILKEFV